MACSRGAATARVRERRSGHAWARVAAARGGLAGNRRRWDRCPRLWL